MVMFHSNSKSKVSTNVRRAELRSITSLWGQLKVTQLTLEINKLFYFCEQECQSYLNNLAVKHLKQNKHESKETRTSEQNKVLSAAFIGMLYGTVFINGFSILLIFL